MCIGRSQGCPVCIMIPMDKAFVRARFLGSNTLDCNFLEQMTPRDNKFHTGILLASTTIELDSKNRVDMKRGQDFQ